MTLILTVDVFTTNSLNRDSDRTQNSISIIDIGRLVFYIQLIPIYPGGGIINSVFKYRYRFNRYVNNKRNMISTASAILDMHCRY